MLKRQVRQLMRVMQAGEKGAGDVCGSVSRHDVIDVNQSLMSTGGHCHAPWRCTHAARRLTAVATWRDVTLRSAGSGCTSAHAHSHGGKPESETMSQPVRAPQSNAAADDDDAATHRTAPGAGGACTQCGTAALWTACPSLQRSRRDCASASASYATTTRCDRVAGKLGGTLPPLHAFVEGDGSSARPMGCAKPSAAPRSHTCTVHVSAACDASFRLSHSNPRGRRGRRRHMTRLVAVFPVDGLQPSTILSGARLSSRQDSSASAMRLPACSNASVGSNKSTLVQALPAAANVHRSSAATVAGRARTSTAESKVRATQADADGVPAARRAAVVGRPRGR